MGVLTWLLAPGVGLIKYSPFMFSASETIKGSWFLWGSADTATRLNTSTDSLITVWIRAPVRACNLRAAGRLLEVWLRSADL